MGQNKEKVIYDKHTPFFLLTKVITLYIDKLLSLVDQEETLLYRLWYIFLFVVNGLRDIQDYKMLKVPIFKLYQIKSLFWLHL